MGLIELIFRKTKGDLLLKRDLLFLSYIIVKGLILFTCCTEVYSQNLQAADSGNAPSVFSSDTFQKKISYCKPSAYFYKTDSIFSFRSPKGYVPSLVHNFGEQAAVPFHFKTKDWIITGTAMGITAALIHFDNDIDDWARTQKQKHNWVNKSSPFITSFGSNTGIFSVIAFGSLSAALKNEKGVQTSLLATQAMITSGVWVRLIKILSGRERPSAAYDFSRLEGGKWYGPYAQFDQDLASRKPGSSFDSFVSGHTATAFSIATVFALEYRDIKAVPIISYTAATLVGISRLTEHAHWASDVLVGAVFGYFCGKQVVSHYNKTHQNVFNSMQSKSKIKTELTFIQYGNQVGFLIRW
jgi:membrane-associated phospholipid phosphatase